jgi:hypothetical protein
VHGYIRVCVRGCEEGARPLLLCHQLGIENHSKRNNMFIVLEGTGLHCMIGDCSVENCEPESFQDNHYNKDCS